jgi:hypothetical protein
VSQETTNRSFDDLARALAEGSISRRRALRLFAGSAIAALIPSTRAMAAITCPKGTVNVLATILVEHTASSEGAARLPVRPTASVLAESFVHRPARAAGTASVYVPARG